jgi:hypothetical protein
MVTPGRRDVTTTRLTVPWGDATLDLELPDAWPEPEVAWPDLGGGLDPAAYPGALAAAIDAPGVWPGEAIRPGAKVAIVVDDPSRWTPVREALPALLSRLHGAGVEAEDVSISAGVGRHAPVDDAAMRRRVGDAIVGRYACHSPPVDDLSRYVDLGATPEGVPVRVFRPVAEADVRLLIGSVLPHLQAGFGGGLKLIFPGCSHRSTLGALHRQGLSGNAAALLGGDPAQNPMRRAIRGAAGRLPGVNLSISHLLGTPGQVLHVAAGAPDAVQGGLAVEAQRRFRVPAGTPADIVVAGNAPWPGDPMQSFKVLLNHRAAGRPGGVLVGLFWTDPDEIDRSFPLGPMRLIAASGAVGGWALRRGLAGADRVASGLDLSASFMIRWARELVVDRTVLVYAPLLRRRLGPRLGPIRLFDAMPPLWAAARGALRGEARDTPRLRVFPRGGLTYCPHPDVNPPA